MKSEPLDYSIDDLERDGKERWDGVRNYQVRNMMRDDMSVGDKALFYHSNAGKDTGVAGEMAIVSHAYPDPTQFDPTLTFSLPQQVSALRKIVKSYTSKNTKVSLVSLGKNDEKVRVRVNMKNAHPDPKSDPVNPRWLCVDVSFVAKFPRTVTLAEIKNTKELQQMRLVQKGNRLSVTQITKNEFAKIKKLANGGQY